MDKLLTDCLTGESYTVYAYFAPQSRQKPYVVFNVVSNPKDNHSNGQGDMIETRYDIKVYSDTLDEAQSISTSIQDKLLACDEFEAFVYQDIEDISDDTKTFISIIDVKLIK